MRFKDLSYMYVHKYVSHTHGGEEGGRERGKERRREREHAGATDSIHAGCCVGFGI